MARVLREATLYKETGRTNPARANTLARGTLIRGGGHGPHYTSNANCSNLATGL